MSFNVSISAQESQFVTLQVPDQSSINEENVDRFFNLYALSFKNNTAPEATQLGWMTEDFSTAKNCWFHWRDLTVTLPLTKIEEVLMNTGVLQLRPVPEECRTLIAGCGNEPIANGAGYPLEAKSVHEEGSEKYRRIHSHQGAVTINPHLGYNPTLVGFFGGQTFPMIKDHQMDLIVVESTSISDTSIGREELKRILHPEGKIVMKMGNEKGYEFSWEENAKNVWDKDYKLPKVSIENLHTHESFK